MVVADRRITSDLVSIADVNHDIGKNRFLSMFEAMCSKLQYSTG